MRCSGWLGRWWAPCLWRGWAEAGRPAPGASGIERVCLGKGSAGPGFSLGSNFLLGDLGQVVWGGLRWRRHEHVLYPCSWWRPRHLAGGCWPARNPSPLEMLSVALEPSGDPSHWYRCEQSAQCYILWAGSTCPRWTPQWGSGLNRFCVVLADSSTEPTLGEALGLSLHPCLSSPHCLQTPRAQPALGGASQCPWPKHFWGSGSQDHSVWRTQGPWVPG